MLPQWIYFLCSAVLHMSNVRFTPTDQGEGSAVDPQTQQSLALAAHYLQVVMPLPISHRSHRCLSFRPFSSHLS